MKRLEPESVGDVLRQALDRQNMSEKLRETRACVLWVRIVGPQLAQITGKPSVKNGIMTVGVPNAALRSELMMVRSQMIGQINSILGFETITDIRYTS